MKFQILKHMYCGNPMWPPIYDTHIDDAMNTCC